MSTETGYIGGILLQMETVEDEFGKAIARYEYPYADGADLEDMGQKPHVIRMRCYFWDGGGNTTYDDHIALIRMLETEGLLDLIHPKYGLLQGAVEAVHVRHDDTRRTAEVDITFIEQMRGVISPDEAGDVEADAEAAYLDGQQAQQDSLAAEAAEALREEKGFIDQVLDAGQGIYEQFTGAAGAARRFVRKIDAYVGMFQAVVTEIVNPINSLQASVNYAVTLPGRVIGPIAQAVERTARLYDSLRDSPARFLSSLKFGLLKLEVAADQFSADNTPAGAAARSIILRQLRIASAQRMALEAAYLFAEDETRRSRLRRLEQTRTFDRLGRYVASTQPAPVMTVEEIERSLADVREMIQTAVDEARGLRPLQEMARALLEHVNTIKLEREKIVTVTIDSPLPLHLVCLKYGLDYHYAERILSINPGLRNPSAVSGEVRIYAR